MTEYNYTSIILDEHFYFFNNSLMKKSILVLLLTFSLILSGCGLFDKGPQKPPEDVIKTGITNYLKNASAVLAINLNGSIEGETEGKKEQTGLNLNISGKYDKKDEKNIKIDMMMGGDVTYKDKKYDGELGLKLVDKKLYFNLLKYPQDIAKDAPQLAVIPALAQKWFYVSVEQAQGAVPLKLDAAETPETKQLWEEAEKTNFFKDLKYKGKEEIAGVKAYKYTGVLDKDKLFDFIIKASEINKSTPPTDTEKADLKKGLSYLNIPAEFWVSVDTETLVRAKGVINYNDTEKKTAISLDFDAQASNINEPITVEAPKDAVDFTQAMGGAQMPAK